MDLRTGDPIIGHQSRATAGNASLVSLDASVFGAMFHAWRGASGRRYVATVHAVDPASEDCALPAFTAFVLVAVRREGVAHRPLSIVAIERESDKCLVIADALARGVDAWHVHLLAADRPARAKAVADLLARHGMPAATALSA